MNLFIQVYMVWSEFTYDVWYYFMNPTMFRKNGDIVLSPQVVSSELHRNS